MGSLHPSAYYQEGDFEMHMAHLAEHASMIGNTRALHYLEENFGVRVLSDEQLRKNLERVQREDPHGLRTLIMLKMLEARGRNDEKKAKTLKELYARTFELFKTHRNPTNPNETEHLSARPYAPGYKDILCQVLTGKSVFDFPKGKSPSDKWLA